MKLRTRLILSIVACLFSGCKFLPEVSEVRLSESSVSLKVGESITLVASVEPAAAEYDIITWTSSNPAVASVSNGLVRAYRIGTAQIYASTEGVTSSPCQVTVKTTPVNNVQLDKTSVSLAEGETLTLKATVYPADATNGKVTWSTGDKSIATVSSSGNVTAVSEGVTTIYAIAEDGGYSTGCKVTVTAVYVTFPDANFRKYMIDNFDLNKNGKISMSEAKKVTSIKVSTVDIESLEGIEYLENLESLDISNKLSSWSRSRNDDGSWSYYNYSDPQGKISSLDVSKNKALKYLYCRHNQITSLDLSNNTKLLVLNCELNSLSSISFSINSSLNTINCSDNQLSYLDVTKNTALTSLSCYYNQLASLDISKNTALTSLSCYYNQLASLDVSKNTALTSLLCDSNHLTSLDVTKNAALIALWCRSNQLTSLDVTKNTVLSSLLCNSNQLTSLDVSKNTELISLWCDSNQLTSLDVTKNIALTQLLCSSNQLTSLDVTKNIALTELFCSSNQLTSLDVSKNAALTRLYCYSNRLTSLDVSKNIALTELGCWSNQLTNLDVSKNTQLTYLDCNPMKNNSLQSFYMSTVQSISTLDVPSYTQIIRK